MSPVRRFDHVGITVADLGAVTAFFVGLGLEVQGGPMPLEGDFLDAVTGIPDASTEMVMQNVRRKSSSRLGKGTSMTKIKLTVNVGSNQSIPTFMSADKENGLEDINSPPDE